MNGDNLKGLVEFIVQSLVDQPTNVNIKEFKRGNSVQLDLQVAKEDMGRVIGKGGRVANSIRCLLYTSDAADE